MDLAGHKRMFEERAKFLANFPPDNLLRKDEPPPAPPASLPPMELSDESAREYRRAQAAREIELALRAEAEAQPRPLDLSRCRLSELFGG